MKRLVSQLPPLKSLVAFEAVMRLGTVTAAAKELTATQPAVSQHIKWLEQNLNATLFVKSGRRLKPTPAAMQYYVSVQAALHSIAEQSEQLREAVPDNQVPIIAHTGLASLWLLPRLPALKQACPEVSISVTLSDSHVTDNARPSAIYLQFGRLNQSPQHQSLFTERVCIVAGNDYAKNHDLSVKTPLLEALQHPLIHMDEADNRWLNWRDFLAPAKQPLPQHDDKILLGNYHSVVSQARRNHGLALGWRGIIDELLAGGELVQVTVYEQSRPDYGYFIDTAGLDDTRLAVVRALCGLVAYHQA